METKFTEIMDMMLGVERIIKQMLIEIMVKKNVLLTNLQKLIGRK